MQTLDAIKTRRTIRKFTEEPVSHEVIEKIVEASAYAPSWKNTQTARYIIIEETALKDRIAREAVMGFEWNTGIILGAPVLVVLASVPGKSGYEKDGAYSTSKKDKWEMFDAGIAAQTFQLAAHEERRFPRIFQDEGGANLLVHRRCGGREVGAHFHDGVVPFDGLLKSELGALVDREEAARLALEYLGLERSRHRDQKNIVLQ